MNIVSFITKGLRFRPQRTLFLLLGFAVGVMVMTVLLSVGTAVLRQAMDEDLTGGGDVVLLPAGIDVSVLKTGGVTALNFDIPNARFLTRETLSDRRLPGVEVVSPELSRVTGTLRFHGHERLVRMDGVVPSRFRELWPAVPAAFVDGPAERDYIDPQFTSLLTRIDAFHTPVADSSRTWAEWHYFNYHDDAGRSLYVSVSGVTFGSDVAASGYSRGVVLFEMVDERGVRTKIVDVLPGREVKASTTSPDLIAGLNTVRLDSGVYTVSLALADSLQRPVTVSLSLTPVPHQVAPPITPLGAEEPFGYVVPVVRGPMTGRVTMGGRTVELAGVGYHDHNWGDFRDAVWDWGIVHAGPYSVLYGRFAATGEELARRPVFVALFDAKGPRPFMLTGDYHVTWAFLDPVVPPGPHTPAAANLPGETPQSVSLFAAAGADTVMLHLEFSRHFVSETGKGEGGLFGARDASTSLFYQLEGHATLTGRLDGAPVRETGHAYAETFFAR